MKTRFDKEFCYSRRCELKVTSSASFFGDFSFPLERTGRRPYCGCDVNDSEGEYSGRTPSAFFKATFFALMTVFLIMF